MDCLGVYTRKRKGLVSIRASKATSAPKPYWGREESLGEVGEVACVMSGWDGTGRGEAGR